MGNKLYGIGAALAIMIATQSHHYVMPNHKLTPGVARTDLSFETICTTKWGKDVRHVTEKMKKDVCKAYGITSGCPGPKYEIDHLISRELGGADDEKNLWPQPIDQARIKDVVETRTHKKVCAKTIPLRVAQSQIADDWTKLLEDK